MRHAIRIAAILLLLVIRVGSTTAQEKKDSADAKKPEWVTLKSPCIDFAMNPETGALAGVDANAGTVTLYPRDYLDGKNTEVVGPVKVCRFPVSIVFKRYKEKSYFVVTGQRDGIIDVLDARNLRSVRRIITADLAGAWLATSQSPEDPSVYYAIGGVGGGRASRISMETMSEEHIPLRDAVNKMWVSGEGRLLYVKNRHGLFVMEVTRTKETAKADRLGLRELAKHGNRMWSLVPYSWGGGVSRDGTLMSEDLKTTVAKFSFNRDLDSLQNPPGPRRRRRRPDWDGRSPLTSFVMSCFFSSLPVGIGISEKRVVAISCNSYKSFGAVPLPDGFEKAGEWVLPKHGNPNKAATRFAYGVKGMADETGRRAVHAIGDRVVVTTFKELCVVDEPLMFMTVKAPPACFVNRENVIELQPAEKQCSIELVKAPQGMKLEGRRLVWIPMPQQLGKGEAVVKLVCKGFTRTETIPLSVTCEFVKPDFTPAAMTVSESGKWLLLWESFNPQVAGTRGRSRITGTNLTLVDLEARKISASRTLIHGTETAAVDDQSVYIVPQGKGPIDLLSLVDLSDVKSVLVRGRALAVKTTGADGLFVVTEDECKLYKTPQMTAKKFLVFPKPRNTKPYGNPDLAQRMLPRRVGDSYYVNGCLYDSDFTRPHMLIAPWSFFQPPQRRRRGVSNLTPPVPWSRKVGPGGLSTSLDKVIGGVIGDHFAIMNDFPVLGSLKVTDSDGRFMARLVLAELVKGSAVESLCLFDAPAGGLDYRVYKGSRQKRVLIAAGSQFIAQVGDRIFFFPVTPETLKKCMPPFEFEPDRAVIEVETGVKTEINHRLRGGTPPFDFALVQSVVGASIDSKTGTVTVDGVAFLGDISKRMARDDNKKALLLALIKGANEPATSNNARILSDVRENAKFLVGREVDYLPMMMALSVVARDSEGRTVIVDHKVVFKVNQDQLLEGVAVELQAIKDAEPVRFPRVIRGRTSRGQVARNNQELIGIHLARTGGTPEKPEKQSTGSAAATGTSSTGKTGDKTKTPAKTSPARARFTRTRSTPGRTVRPTYSRERPVRRTAFESRVSEKEKELEQDLNGLKGEMASVEARLESSNLALWVVSLLTLAVVLGGFSYLAVLLRKARPKS